MVASAVKLVFDKHGNRKNRNAARLRFLWKTLGEAQFRTLYEDQLRQVRSESPAPLSIEELPQYSDLPPFPLEEDHSLEFDRWKDRFVENQRQYGLVSVRIPVFLGNLENASAIRLAEFLAPFGNHVLRASFGQNLRLRNIPKDYLANVFHLVSEIFPLSSSPSFAGNSIACTGADTCRLGICLPKRALAATVERLTASTFDLDSVADFKLSISGCPNTCGQHMLADLGFYGNVGRMEQNMFPAYIVVAGAEIGEGKSRLARPIDRVSARNLPEFIHEVLKQWIVKKSKYSSFAQYVDSEGEREIQEIAGRFRAIPAYSQDASYYRDWGATETFSLVGRGVGECSAGLFDLIELDLKSARQTREDIRLEDMPGDLSLYDISLRSARALLITRGIEAPTDAAIFDNFLQHFIRAGLVDRRFEGVVLTARHKNIEELKQLDGDVFELLDAVESLYRSMDNSLRFPAEARVVG